MHYLQFLFFFFCKIEQEHKDICEIIWMQNISRFISFSNLLHFSWQHFVCVCGKKHNMRSTLITNVWVYSTLLLNISAMLYIGSLGLFHLAWYWSLIPAAAHYFLLPPAAGNHHSTFWFDELDYFRYLI